MNSKKESMLNDEKNDELLQFVTFFIGEELYGVDIYKVREVIKLIDITTVPRSNEYVVGVINLRGQVIPVIDLRLRLSLLAREFDKHTRIIISEVKGKNVGMIVDRMNKVERVQESKMKKETNVISSIDSDFVDRIGKIGDNIMVVIDLELLFGKM
ncbi:MAG: chemotaxis protein CheW [Candidatus Margulisbacteria bacterium]|nr:chemotaxis protein CheW [Candidatus Margulisiibacteriota bacterium]